MPVPGAARRGATLNSKGRGTHRHVVCCAALHCTCACGIAHVCCLARQLLPALLKPHRIHVLLLPQAASLVVSLQQHCVRVHLKALQHVVCACLDATCWQDPRGPLVFRGKPPGPTPAISLWALQLQALLHNGRRVLAAPVLATIVEQVCAWARTGRGAHMRTGQQLHCTDRAMLTACAGWWGGGSTAHGMSLKV